MREWRHRSPARTAAVAAALSAASLFLASVQAASPAAAAESFRQRILPILQEHCYDCHGDGANKGNVAFDEFKSEADLLAKPALWLATLKNVRAGIMPPEKKPRLSAGEIAQLEQWIEREAFGIDPQNPDPGRVTVRRLNRVEYRNTIRDLLGVDYDTKQEFPPDDTGHGFDNIADVLTVSPMLLEKYLDAARAIIAQTVPVVPSVPAEQVVYGSRFRSLLETNAPAEKRDGPVTLSYYEPASLAGSVPLERAGRYQVVLDFTANERYVDNRFDYNKCRLVFKVDGEELLRQDFNREGGKAFRFEFDRDWQPGEHTLALELEPLTPGTNQIRSLSIRLGGVTVRGPMEEKYYVPPKNHARFFPRPVPPGKAARHHYALEILGEFAARAFRAPVDDHTASRLADLAEDFYEQPGQTFEAGVAKAMTAVLASPRFLFREEGVLPSQSPFPLIDEYALASRLSYFLWSSMPDQELFRLAREGRLRRELSAQVARMLADPKSEAFISNFTGQWLQARDIETVQIDARSVLAREDGNPNRGRTNGFGFRRPRAVLDDALRRDMRRETEMYFSHIMKEDRSVAELLDSDYTFLNESLAKHYGLTNLSVAGPELRRVSLPPGSPRGGVLTQGTVLAVTSNPTRTSPVKRGLFVLENILGTPPPPAPPDIPPLEDAARAITDREPTLRETLELHRGQAVCSSCHNRMDPLGLALENFNAMGMWREEELKQPVDSAGKLISGESFGSIQELKRILADKHRAEFYHTLAEKLLTYALGRGLEHYDIATLDQIAERMSRENGKFSALLMGVIESAPFQKRRALDADDSSAPPENQQRADASRHP